MSERFVMPPEITEEMRLAAYREYTTRLCASHRLIGRTYIAFRGMVMRGLETEGPNGAPLIYDAFRFDVLYRSETMQ